MIYRYEIKKIHGEERLYLYLNLNYEFANLDLKTKKKSLEKAINEFLIKNKIVFKGSIVSLIVGGILVGDLVLKQPVSSKETSMLEVITPKVVEVDALMKVPVLPKIEEIEIITPEDNTQEMKSSNITTPVPEKKNTSTIKKNTTIDSSKSQTTTPSTTKVETSDASEKEESKEVVDDAIYVTVNRSNGQILKIELEEYLIGVVGSEMPALFNLEALKAQAVVSRTYTLKAILKGKVLTDTASTQTYKNKSELQTMWGSNFNAYYSKIQRAISETKGQYLTYNGTYIEAVFHSTSNGKTEDASNVWGNSFPYLVSVESPYDTENPSFSYEMILSYDTLTQKLGMEVNQDTIFNVLGRTIGNRISQIALNDKTFTGVEFRNKLGLRSADFEIEKVEGGIKIKTFGYGHGVGMSQYGANGMAKNGNGYQTILKHYYKGVTINSL